MRLYILLTVLFCSELNAQTCSVFITSTPEHCSQICNGEAQANATGQGALTYLWQPGGQTTAVINGLCPGSYTVTVTDSAGCTAVDSTTINAVAPLVVWISNVTDPSCVGCADGCAVGNASGGSPPYTGLWTPPFAATMNYCGMSDSVIYTFCVSDANGCVVCADTTVNDPTGVETFYTVRSEVCQLQVFDLFGHMVQAIDYRASLSLNNFQLAMGTYVIVELDCEGNALCRRKIIVNE